MVPDPRESAQLGVSFSYCKHRFSRFCCHYCLEFPKLLFCLLSPVTPYSPYLVLTTDYSSVAVVYSCTDILRLFHVEFAWILGRSRFLPAETVYYAKQLLMNEKIDLYRMKTTDQTGCKDD